MIHSLIFWKYHDFAAYIRAFCFFGGSEFDTTIEEQKWSGRFVERIWGSDRRSSIGVADFTELRTHTQTRTSPPSKPSRWIPACDRLPRLCIFAMHVWTRSFHPEGGRRIEDAMRRSTADPLISLATRRVTACNCGQHSQRYSRIHTPSLTINEILLKNEGFDYAFVDLDPFWWTRRCQMASK